MLLRAPMPFWNLATWRGAWCGSAFGRGLRGYSGPGPRAMNLRTEHGRPCLCGQCSKQPYRLRHQNPISSFCTPWLTQGHDNRTEEQSVQRTYRGMINGQKAQGTINTKKAQGTV